MAILSTVESRSTKTNKNETAKVKIENNIDHIFQFKKPDSP